MHSFRAGGLVFGSSAAVLMLEILAGRLMAPYVGVSLETFTGIIGTVLAGIAIGAALGGALADRRDPRALIGPALVLGGVLTWASLPILTVLGPSVGTGAGAIVFLTSAAFLAPATVLSAVAPMVAKLRLDDLDETGSVVGGLSAAGTAGALAGTFITGFVLVAAMPTRPVVLSIGVLLVATGVVVAVRSARPGRRAVAATAGAMLVVATAALTVTPPCDRETAYFCVRIEPDPERRSGRDLILDRTRHAHVDLEDPTYLDIRYVRLFAVVSEAVAPGPIDVLHIGGGGFTFPGHLAASRPGSRQLVLEIDPDLPGIAREHLGLETGADLRVRVGDARLELEDLEPGSYDLVVGDAFAGTSVPWHLTTTEVMRVVDRLLRPGGIYVMNVIDGVGSRYARAQLATLAEHFRHVVAILPEDDAAATGPVNQVLVASDAPVGELDLGADDGVVLDGDVLEDYVGDSMVLTDDHAPVDQLMARQ